MDGLLGDKTRPKVGIFDLFRNIYQREGYLGFYKGYLPAITKIILGNGISFGCFEVLKRNFGVDFKKKH